MVSSIVFYTTSLNFGYDCFVTTTISVVSRSVLTDLYTFRTSLAHVYIFVLRCRSRVTTTVMADETAPPGQSDASRVEKSTTILPPGAQWCPKCKCHFLYDDDSHLECMRCRGPDHSCSLCSEMGKKSLERVKDWLSRSCKSNSNNNGATNKGVSQAPRQHTSQERMVSFSDLKEFGDSIKSFVADILKDRSATNSQGATSVHGTGILQPTYGPSSANQSGMEANSGRVAQASFSELSIHPNPGEEFDDEDDDDDDVRSVRSTWDYKRTEGPDVEDDEDVGSIAPSEKEEGEQVTHNQSEHYINLMSELIETLEIDDAVRTSKVRSKITSSRCKDERPKALLPFDENHKQIIDNIWKGNPGEILVSKKSTKGRYKMVDQDFQKYLCPSTVKDDYLVQELEKSGLKVLVKYPKIPNKQLASMDSKVGKIEVSSLLGMACSVSQSWMLQYITTQVQKLDKLLSQGMQPDNYKALNDQVDLKKLADMSILAQDAALDSLDLQARQAAGSKWVKRALWVDQTKWAGSIKDAVKQFPTTGDGTICGPNLKDKLESYRLTSKALEASHFGGPSRGKGGPGKRGRSSGPMKSTAPPSKRFRFDGHFQNDSSRGRGRGSVSRGQPKRQAPSTFPKPSTSSLSG